MHTIFLNLAQRIALRLLGVVFSLFILFLIFFNVLPYFTDKTGWLWGVLITYIISAYLIYPASIRFKNVVFGKKHIPAYTLTPDGLPLDPVNFVFVGSKSQLHETFIKAGWHVADQRNIKNLFKFVYCFIANRPYDTAPFSSLYLFGRKQDIGYQKPIGRSPRKRHHIRFWAVSSKTKLDKKDSWHKEHKKTLKSARIWVGSATEDTGLGYRKDTFQITHAINNNADEEREFIIKELRFIKAINSIETYNVGEELIDTPEPINHFITDGNIKVVFLK